MYIHTYVWTGDDKFKDELEYLSFKGQGISLIIYYFNPSPNRYIILSYIYMYIYKEDVFKQQITTKNINETRLIQKPIRYFKQQHITHTI